VSVRARGWNSLATFGWWRSSSTQMREKKAAMRLRLTAPVAAVKRASGRAIRSSIGARVVRN